MTDAAIAPDLDEALDIGLHRAAQIALHLEGALDVVAQPAQLVLGEVADAGSAGHARLLEDAGAGGATDPEDVGERDIGALLSRQINSGDTCHSAFSLF